MLTTFTISFCIQAIWFTESPGAEGMVLGNTDMWRGLGVLLDSFDNDGLVSTIRYPSKEEVNVSAVHYVY